MRPLGRARDFFGAILAFIVTLAAVMSLHAPAIADDIGNGRAVLVTGATSGFGKRATELLSQRGFFVYAGARSEEDISALNSMPNVEAIRLDVTKQEDVDAAVEQVKRGGRPLYGLINNAGVAVMNPMTVVDEDDLNFVFDVNVFGPWRVTKAFAPMIIDAKGRIINVSSISGIFSALGLGPYSMSKHALEAFNDALALEMAQLGVTVIAIEPGNFDTNIGKAARARMIEKGQSFEGSPYQKALEATMDRLAGSEGKEGPDRVAEVMVEALTVASPKPRYLVVSNDRDHAVTIGFAMKKLIELNGDQPFSYGRDQLVKSLDEAIAKYGTRP